MTIACSAGVFWAGESLFMSVFLIADICYFMTEENWEG